MIGNSWDKTPFEPNMSDRDVHVWRTWLFQAEEDLKQIATILSEQEHAAARKFHFNRDRNRYIISHAILRRIISRYLNVSPVEIKFSRNDYGKPILENNPSEIDFNISHSEDMALFAFAQRHSVGVDIEHIHPIKDLQGVANSFLSPAEMKDFINLPKEAQIGGFFSAWTRKEALSKAIGKGLALPLDRLQVGVNSTVISEPKVGEGTNFNPSNWQLIDLSPSSNYIGAVAIESPKISLSLFTYYE